jgi:hypothetical protein
MIVYWTMPKKFRAMRYLSWETIFEKKFFTLNLSDNWHSEKRRFESAFIIVVWLIFLIYICWRFVWSELLSLMWVNLHLLLLPWVLMRSPKTSWSYWVTASQNLMRDLNSERLVAKSSKIGGLWHLIICTCHDIVGLNQLICASCK